MREREREREGPYNFQFNRAIFLLSLKANTWPGLGVYLLSVQCHCSIRLSWAVGILYFFMNWPYLSFDRHKAVTIGSNQRQ